MTTFSKPKTPPRLGGGHRLELDRLERRLSLLARHLDVDLDELERLAGVDVRAELPSSYEAMVALGLNPETGEMTP